MNITIERHQELLAAEYELACIRRATESFISSFKTCPLCQHVDDEELVHTNTCLIATILDLTKP